MGKATQTITETTTKITIKPKATTDTSNEESKTGQVKCPVCGKFMSKTDVDKATKTDTTVKAK